MVSEQHPRYKEIITDILTDRVPQLAGEQITNDQIALFLRYYEMLVERNEHVNLTAVTAPDEVAVKHYIDSLTLLPHIDSTNAKTLIDVGTGAGFPGLPISIMRPDLKVTLLDSLDKRVRFLQDVIDALGLHNVQAIHGRAEDAGHAGRDGKMRACFDISTARAVAPMNVLCEYCLPFVRVGGIFIAMKGPGAEDDFSYALGRLNAELESDESLTLQLGNEEMKRRLIIVRQKGAMSAQYPRKAGLPGKKPLIKGN